MEILFAFDNSLLALRKICNRSPDKKIERENGGKVWLSVQYLAVWYPIENLLHLYISGLRKV